MKVSVFGLGYVGCVTAACLARLGHQVVGVDVDPIKILALNEGRAPFFEPGLSELVAQEVAEGRLRATIDQADAVRNSDIALVCVGTPTNANGSIRLDYLKHVFTSINHELQYKKDYFVVALRSTVLPVAMEEELIPILAPHSSNGLSQRVGFVYNPEFLREGVALKDFHEAPWTIIGALDSRAGDTAASLYQSLSSPIVRTTPKTAALVKYFSNAFHALKVVFGNEVGAFCRDMGVDGAEMMEIFCQDTKLNISPRYLKPGFAFGGSCLPKDLRALVCEAGRRGLSLPVLESVRVSNEEHLRNCIQVVNDTAKRRIGLVGLSFKAGTDDLRESPAVELAERLIGKGRDVRIYEPSIAPGRLHGTNLDFIERSIPHIWKLLVGSLDELLQHSEVVVVMQQLKADDMRYFSTMRADQVCIDLVRTLTAVEVGGEYYSMDTPRRDAVVL
ncbi:MAG: nucleotide sugar dehydrogenase [Candidatus Sulfotelmatobacter sp.]|jgi:GDP-mannose 6-dehydrogenase